MKFESPQKFLYCHPFFTGQLYFFQSNDPVFYKYIHKIFPIRLKTTGSIGMFPANFFSRKYF